MDNVKTENVFYCKEGHEPVAVVGPVVSKKECPDCKGEMNVIGWFESEGDAEEE